MNDAYYEYVKEFIDVIEDMVCQHCTVDDHLDSMALSANAGAMMLLAECNRIVIETHVGRRIIAHWRTDEPPKQDERKEVKEG